MVASRMEWTQEPGPWTGATIDVRRDGARTGDDGPRTSLLLMFVQPNPFRFPSPLSLVLDVYTYPTKVETKIIY